LALRIVHIINDDCEILFQKNHNKVRIRISDSNFNSSPTEFELEGSVDALRELVSTLNLVMTHADAMSEEMN
jgi:hypothetical protein